MKNNIENPMEHTDQEHLEKKYDELKDADLAILFELQDDPFQMSEDEYEQFLKKLKDIGQELETSYLERDSEEFELTINDVNDDTHNPRNMMESEQIDTESMEFSLDLDDSQDLEKQSEESKDIEQADKVEKPTIKVGEIEEPNVIQDIKDGKLEPNTIYDIPNTDRPSDIYKTDAQGRVIEKVFIPTIVDKKRPNEDNLKTQEVGRSGKEGDHGGHIQAHSLGGTADRINLFPQNGNFNVGDYKAIENGIRNDLKEGKSVKVKVELIYTDNSNRPEKVKVTKEVTDKDGNTEITSITKNNAPKETPNA